VSGSKAIDAILADPVSEHLQVRPAEPADVDVIFSLICELADYERAPEKVTGSAELLRQALFGAERHAEALIAHMGADPAGFALFHGTFSTWECRPGIWLEDLFVAERYRRGGVGSELLSAVAEVARDRGCARLEWAALDWNEPALRFYAGLGAEQLTEWVIHRLDRHGIETVAG
jgi:GNAT superfamily N-acetyltransferase